MPRERLSLVIRSRKMERREEVGQKFRGPGIRRRLGLTGFPAGRGDLQIEIGLRWLNKEPGSAHHIIRGQGLVQIQWSVRFLIDEDPVERPALLVHFRKAENLDQFGEEGRGIRIRRSFTVMGLLVGTYHLQLEIVSENFNDETISSVEDVLDHGLVGIQYPVGFLMNENPAIRSALAVGWRKIEALDDLGENLCGPSTGARLGTNRVAVGKGNLEFQILRSGYRVRRLLGLGGFLYRNQI